MTVLITLTTAGADSGPFNLYSNLTGYTIPFETNVNKAALQAGYSSSLVPDYTGTIRVQSVGDCTNYVDIILQNTTTTSTTLPLVACSGTSSSGVAGVTEKSVSLDPAGGIVIFEVDGQGVPDKFEILHDDVKKATSGMTVSNTGPFDNLYGDPTLPTPTQAENTDQFIGTGSAIAGGVVPTRNSDFFTDTGIPGITVEAGYQQLVWWEYSSSDYSTDPLAILRITGPSGTSWDIKRLCPSTTTTTTTVAPTTTTTTTANPFPNNFRLSTGYATAADACNLGSYVTPVKSNCAPIAMAIGCKIKNLLNADFPGGGNFYIVEFSPYVVQIDGSGNVISVASC